MRKSSDQIQGLFQQSGKIVAGQKRPGINAVKVENTGLVLWQFGSFVDVGSEPLGVSDRSPKALALRERAAFSASKTL